MCARYQRLDLFFVSRRIEIEITSLSGDQATWRAAGARLPKGSMATSMLPSDVKVGAVFRADVDQFMEGIEILAILPPKSASPVDPRNERLEILAPAKGDGEVTVTYASKGRGRGPRTERGERGERPDRGPRGPRRERTERGEGGAEGAPRERRRSERRAEGEGASRGERRGPRGPRTARPSYAGPPVLTTHRNALMAELSPEQLPVAEQIFRGGIAAVRSAVEEQNKNATAQGRPTIDAAVIERIALDLLPKTNLAAWKDRAGGAVSAGRELRLRDLRAVVTAAKTVTLDDEGRGQLKDLKDALTARIEHMQMQWTEKLQAAVAAGDVKEALALVARPPDVSTRVSSEMALTVSNLASAALSADQDPTEWRAIVEVAATTSIRRSIKPTGIPTDDATKNFAVANAGALPEIAKLLGMKVPPPPPPTRTPARTAARATRRSS